MFKRLFESYQKPNKEQSKQPPGDPVTADNQIKIKEMIEKIKEKDEEYVIVLGNYGDKIENLK